MEFSLYATILIFALAMLSCKDDVPEKTPEIKDTFMLRDTSATSKGGSYNRSNAPIRVDRFELSDSAIILTNYYTRYINYFVYIRFTRPLAAVNSGSYRIGSIARAHNEVAVEYRYLNTSGSISWLPDSPSELTIGRTDGKIWISIPEVRMRSSASEPVLYLSASAKEK